VIKNVSLTQDARLAVIMKHGLRAATTRGSSLSFIEKVVLKKS
jgi:hypothetical protein